MYIHETHAIFFVKCLLMWIMSICLSWEIGYYFSLFKIIGFSLSIHFFFLFQAHITRWFASWSDWRLFQFILRIYFLLFIFLHTRLTINRIRMRLWREWKSFFFFFTLAGTDVTRNELSIFSHLESITEPMPLRFSLWSSRYVSIFQSITWLLLSLLSIRPPIIDCNFDNAYCQEQKRKGNEEGWYSIQIW